MNESAKLFNIQITEVHIGDINNIDDFQKDLQAKENIEGIILFNSLPYHIITIR
jgi:hypothetical protein